MREINLAKTASIHLAAPEIKHILSQCKSSYNRGVSQTGRALAKELNVKKVKDIDALKGDFKLTLAEAQFKAMAAYINSQSKHLTAKEAKELAKSFRTIAKQLASMEVTSDSEDILEQLV